MDKRYHYVDPTFPIQIRENLVVRLHPMPHDLTRAEADKICRVVQAMVLPAQGIDARSGQTEGLDPKGESPVPEGNAP